MMKKAKFFIFAILIICGCSKFWGGDWADSNFHPGIRVNLSTTYLSPGFTERLTINATGVSGASNVYIGDSACTNIRVQSSSSISCLPPQLPIGDYSVRLEFVSGESYVVPTTVRYTAFLYMNGSPTAVYRVDSTGSLSQIPQNENVNSTLVLSTGINQYISYFTSSTTMRYGVRDLSTGQLTSLPADPISLIGGIWNASVGPSGNFFYVDASIDLTHQNLYGFAAPTANSGLVPVPSNPLAVSNAIYFGSSDDNQVLASGASGSASVSLYLANSTTGALTEGSNSPLAIAENPIGVNFHPTRDFVYFRGAVNSIMSYAFNRSDGQMTNGNSLALSTYAQELAFDSGSLYGVAAVKNSNTLAVVQVNPTTGALSLVGAEIATITNPADLYFTGTTENPLLLVSSLNQQSVAIYRFSRADGSLSAVSGSPYSVNAIAGTCIREYNQQFYFCINLTTGNLVVYELNQSTGALTQVFTSTFSPGTYSYSQVF